MTPSGLVLRGVERHFGGVAAVSGVDLDLGGAGVTGLIGPNGAGKTTLFNLIAGSVRASRGSIRWDGRELVGRDPGQIARAGLVRSFQQPLLLPGVSVRDHLLHAASLRSLGHPLNLPRLLLPGGRRASAAARQRADWLLDFVQLGPHATAQADALPYGLQKILGLALALAAAPRLLLADEPAAGLHSAEKQRMQALLRAIHDEFDVPIVVIEHDMRLVMALCDRIVVLAQGKVIADGSPDVVRRLPVFIEAYLGGEVAC